MNKASLDVLLRTKINVLCTGHDEWENGKHQIMLRNGCDW